MTPWWNPHRWYKRKEADDLFWIPAIIVLLIVGVGVFLWLLPH